MNNKPFPLRNYKIKVKMNNKPFPLRNYKIKENFFFLLQQDIWQRNEREYKS